MTPTPVPPFEDESPSGATDISGRIQATRFLPGKASIKDDLQQVYEMEKEIGSAVFRLHRLLNQVHVATSTVAKTHEMEEAIKSVMDKLTEYHDVLQGRLDAIKTANDSQHTHNARVEDDWEKLLTAANIILKTNGVDPKTLAEQPEEVKRLGRWLNHIQSVVVGIIITLLSAWIMSAYSKSLLSDQKAANDALVKEVTAAVELVKKQQQELNDHVATEKKARGR